MGFICLPASICVGIFKKYLYFQYLGFDKAIQFLFCFALSSLSIFFCFYSAPVIKWLIVDFIPFFDNNICGEALHHFSILDSRPRCTPVEMGSNWTMPSLSPGCQHARPPSSVQTHPWGFEKFSSLPDTLQSLLPRKVLCWLLESLFNLFQNGSGWYLLNSGVRSCTFL